VNRWPRSGTEPHTRQTHPSARQRLAHASSFLFSESWVLTTCESIAQLAFVCDVRGSLRLGECIVDENRAIALTENCYSQRDCKKSGRELFWQNVYAWTAGRTSLPGVSGITLGDRLRLSGSCIVRRNRALVSRTKLFLSPLPDDSIRLRRSPKISARIFPSAAPHVSHDRGRFRSLGESSARELPHP
jgi:hypothetical protein